MITDREFVRANYSQSLKAWLGDLGDGKHDGGPNDPRIGVIRVKAVTATYAIAVGTVLGRGAEIVKGALTGEAPKVNKLRELREEELDQCMFFFFFSFFPYFAIGHYLLESKHKSVFEFLDNRHPCTFLFFSFFFFLDEYPN